MMWASTTPTTQHIICGADSAWSLSKRILALQNVRVDEEAEPGDEQGA
jgi:hypothetical protein